MISCKCINGDTLQLALRFFNDDWIVQLDVLDDKSKLVESHFLPPLVLVKLRYLLSNLDSKSRVDGLGWKRTSSKLPQGEICLASKVSEVGMEEINLSYFKNEIAETKIYLGPSHAQSFHRLLQANDVALERWCNVTIRLSVERFYGNSQTFVYVDRFSKQSGKLQSEFRNRISQNEGIGLALTDIFQKLNKKLKDKCSRHEAIEFRDIAHERLTFDFTPFLTKSTMQVTLRDAPSDPIRTRFNTKGTNAANKWIETMVHKELEEILNLTDPLSLGAVNKQPKEEITDSNSKSDIGPAGQPPEDLSTSLAESVHKSLKSFEVNEQKWLGQQLCDIDYLGKKQVLQLNKAHKFYKSLRHSVDSLEEKLASSEREHILYHTELLLFALEKSKDDFSERDPKFSKKLEEFYSEFLATLSKSMATS